MFGCRGQGDGRAEPDRGCSRPVPRAPRIVSALSVSASQRNLQESFPQRSPLQKLGCRASPAAVCVKTCEDGHRLPMGPGQPLSR